MFGERLSRHRRWATLLLSGLLFACPDDPPTVTNPDTGIVQKRDTGVMDSGSQMDAAVMKDAGVVEVDAGECETLEPGPNVRFKGDRRIERHFTDVLELDRAELCSELGQYNCVDIHRVALGGVDPYALGLYEKLPNTTATAPLAVDRLALSGCRERFDRDDGEDSPLIFSGDRSTTIDNLYKRALARRATSEEIGILEDLHATIATSAEPNPDRSWGILACYAVLTSVESLFY